MVVGPYRDTGETSPAVLHGPHISLLLWGSATSPAALTPLPQNTLELFLGSAAEQECWQLME